MFFECLGGFALGFRTSSALDPHWILTGFALWLPDALGPDATAQADQRRIAPCMLALISLLSFDSFQALAVCRLRVPLRTPFLMMASDRQLGWLLGKIGVRVSSWRSSQHCLPDSFVQLSLSLPLPRGSLSGPFQILPSPLPLSQCGICQISLDTRLPHFQVVIYAVRLGVVGNHSSSRFCSKPCAADSHALSLSLPSVHIYIYIYKQRGDTQGHRDIHTH